MCFLKCILRLLLPLLTESFLLSGTGIVVLHQILRHKGNHLGFQRSSFITDDNQNLVYDVTVNLKDSRRKTIDPDHRGQIN